MSQVGAWVNQSSHGSTLGETAIGETVYDELVGDDDDSGSHD